jgi:hypothetical protein
MERALLAAFAELVQARNAGPVAGIGCGPGHVTAPGLPWLRDSCPDPGR